jgi:hypothetical protein
MALERHNFYSSVRGVRQDDEDWYTLLIDTVSGVKSVEHEWSYGDVYGRLTANAGKEVLPVEEFQSRCISEDAKIELRALLALIDEAASSGSPISTVSPISRHALFGSSPKAD